MGELDQDENSPPSLPVSSKKKHLMTSAMKRTSEWIFSQEIPSDITVQAGGASFTLHKFPLISKCGYIKKFVAGATDTEQLVLELAEIPGGEEAFELAAKFCYGINFEINTDNIAMLRCVAEFLEMTEDYAVGNLVSRTESYLIEVAMTSLAGALSVLHCSESLLPMAEKVKLVNRCVDAIAYVACEESQTYLPDRTENNNQIVQSSNSKPIVDWWAEDLTVLRIDIFQRVIMAMIARGFKQYALGPVLMLYAQKSLRGLELFGKGRKKIDPKQEHEKRVVLETIVSLLPREKNTMSVSFLAMLLRAAIYLETTVACRLDLEKRMGLQLGQAVLDDLLIPSYSFTGDTLFDVDTVQRIMANYLEYEVDGNRLFYKEDDEFNSPPPSDMERVGKLMESYLAEIASDRNLSVSRFISLAELIPEQARITEDGMYRAIDIYMKAHPTVSDMERKKVCSLMDCQKLSREACAHAAQNDRLPVQTVVQVLYYEQQRLRDAMNGNASGAESPAIPKKTNLYSDNNHAAPNELQKLRRENEDLKIELARTRMRLKELENNTAKSSSVGTATASQLEKNTANSSSVGTATASQLEKNTATASPPVGPPTPSAGKPPLPRKSFIGSVSKKLGRLVRPDMLKPSDAKVRTKPSKDRRHSIS